MRAFSAAWRTCHEDEAAVSLRTRTMTLPGEAGDAGRPDPWISSVVLTGEGA